MKKNILIIILVLLVLGLAGYICYDNGLFKKKDNQQKEEKIVEEELALDDSRFIDLYNEFAFDAYSKDINSQKDLGLNGDKLISMGMSSIKESDLEKTNEKNKEGSLFYSLKLDDFDKGIKKYLGSDFEYDPSTLVGEVKTCMKLGETSSDPESMEGDCFTFEKYDKTSNKFYGVFSPVGGYGFEWYPSKALNIYNQEIEKAVLKGDTITVTTKVIYYDEDYDEDANSGNIVVNYFSDRAKKNKIDTKTYAYKAHDENKYTIKASEFENVGHIIYTFKHDKDLDSYYFYSAVEEKE